MTAWKAVYAIKINTTHLDATLTWVSEKLTREQAIEILPLGTHTEQGDSGPVTSYDLLVLIGTPIVHDVVAQNWSSR